MLQNMIDGSMMGCIYGMIALGLSLIFGVMNIVNFAHGDFVMLSMYVTFFVSTLIKVDAVVTPVVTMPLMLDLVSWCTTCSSTGPSGRTSWYRWP